MMMFKMIKNNFYVMTIFDDVENDTNTSKMLKICLALAKLLACSYFGSL